MPQLQDNYSLLQPQIRDFEPDYILDDCRDIFRGAKYIDQLDRIDCRAGRGEIGIGSFAQRAFDMRD